MSRRTAGAAATAQPRVGEGRASGRGSTGETRAARRLAASLGPPATAGLAGDEETERLRGARATGLLEPGTPGGFIYGRQADSPGSETSSEPVEPRFRWRLGIRAAALVGGLSLLAGAMFWWQVAANGPVVTPLSSVTHGAEGETAGGESGRGSRGQVSEGTGNGSDERGTTADANDADGPAGGAADNKGQVAGNVVVHVAGAVKKAGVVRLPRGSRVHEAIAAAGGASAEADLDRLNLASLLEDGQKVYVPRRGEAAPADPVAGPPGSGSTREDSSGSGGTSGGSAPAGGGNPGAEGAGAGAKVNLNTATAEQLAELPKVGPVLAERIVDWRTQQGPFKSPEELDAVDGVGPKMLETLLPLVTV